VEVKSVLLEQFTELLAELFAENMAECLDGQEEPMRRVYPSGTIEGQTSGGNDVVYVGMNLEVLSPGMEHAKESDVGSQVLWIASEFKQRSGTGAEEQIVEQPFVLEDQSAEFVRQGEDDVEVRHGQQLSRTRGQPLGARVPLALGTVPIAAGNGELTIKQSIFSAAPWHDELVVSDNS